MARLAAIWRHPIKSHGREALQAVALRAGESLPWDRVWALAHEASKFDPATRAWAACPNFVLGSKAPALMAIEAVTDEGAGTVTLSHPTGGSLTVNPDRAEDAARLVAWSDPFVPSNRARPAFVARATRAMTDTDYPSVSLLSFDSLADLSARAGRELAPGRFRGNLWIAGWEPWEEFALIGRVVTIGTVRLALRERIRRCSATATDPATGTLDFDTPAFLEQTFGHRDFGVYAEVLSPGAIALGDLVTAEP